MPVLDPAVRARYDAEWRPLIRDVAYGDVDAFGRLYDLASPVVFLLTRLVLKDSREAEEATLEAFEVVWQRADEFLYSRQSPSSWIARIANERALARRRIAANAFPGEIPGGAGTAGGGSASRVDGRPCHLRASYVPA
jgi:RNA polymerase sigma-70 factor, ECF subfamily